MSSALAMVLTAAMAVPGNGPEKVPGEVEQRLDLSGELEGTWRDARGKLMTAASTPFTDNSIVGERPGGIVFIPLASIIDEGKGRFRIACEGDSFLGIYKQHGGQVILCFCPAREGYPTSFCGGNGQHLLILRHAKPGK